MRPVKYSLLCLFLISAVNSHAQIPALAFQKSLGGSDQEYPPSAHQTADGGFIVIGTSYSSDGDFTMNMGYGDVWVIKLDGNLNVQWKKNYGGTGHEEGYEIFQRNDGSYIFMGRTLSNDNDVTGNHGSSDIWVVKLDTAGNITWQKCYGGSYHESGISGTHNCTLTNDGGFVVAVSSNSNDGDVSGNHGQGDFWIFKADSSGNIQWQNSYGGSSEDYACSVQQAFDGGYIVFGDTKSDDGDVTNRPFPGSLYDDYWVVKLDSAGIIQWQKCLGGSDFDIPYKIIETNGSQYTAVGWTASDDGDVTSNHGLIDAWMVKLDAAGNMIWQHCIGGSGDDMLYDLLPADDGGYIAAGATIDAAGVPLNSGFAGSHGGWDVLIVKLDSLCNLQWEKRCGGTSHDLAYSIDFAQNGYIIGAKSTSNDFDLTDNKGNEDMWVVKLVDHSNSITGQVYLDTITNGLHDAPEPLLYNKLITESTTGRMAFTDVNGMYDLSVLTSGTFSVQAPVVNYHTVSPASYPIAFSYIDQIDSLNDFPAAPVPGMNDLQISMVPSGDFNLYIGSGGYGMFCKNVGTTTLSATVKMFPGNYLIYDSASINPSMITPDSIIWTAVNLVPWQEINIGAGFNIDPGASVGALITTSCIIEPVAGDMDTTNNFSQWTAPVVSSYDPNDKIVSHTLLTTAQLALQPYLDYVIHFQNTGTDTATNVMIADNIRNKLDMSTFEFINASHPVQLEYQNASRLVEFHFNNIQLPDSNVNEPASHGFVHYRIRPYDTLAAGSIIRNKAAIYFDFNEPVLTNTVITSVVQPVLIEENQIDFPSLNVYPDPASKELTVLSTEVLSDFTIYDISGRTLVKSELKSRKFLLDVSSFSDGIYLLRVSDGKKQMYKKFVVKR